jgi:hypothetical protein
MSIPMLLALTGVGISGCASTYSNLVSGSKLGAQEYTPAVLAPTPEAQAKYAQILPICQQVAVNRQVTSAEEAQLRSITGTVNGAASGAAMGFVVGDVFRSTGLHTSIAGATAVGLGVGLVSSLADAFAAGTQHTADETKKILVRCLKSQEQASGYQVMEDAES